MRALLLTAALLASFPAGARPAPPRHRVPARVAGPGKPVDVGPFTPAANRAYQGGGVILEGAPGAPAPEPRPTPPGQAPANALRP